MTMNPEPLTVKVVSILESEREVVLTLAPTEWAIDAHPDDDENFDTEPAEPGQPGAFWLAPGGPQIIVHLPREKAVMFDVGRHYVLALNEIVDAPITEFEPA